MYAKMVDCNGINNCSCMDWSKLSSSVGIECIFIQIRLASNPKIILVQSIQLQLLIPLQSTIFAYMDFNLVNNKSTA